MLASTLASQRLMGTVVVAAVNSRILIMQGCNRLSGCRNNWTMMFKTNPPQMNIRGLLLLHKIQK
jgi:hypothetical protein